MNLPMDLINHIGQFSDEVCYACIPVEKCPIRKSLLLYGVQMGDERFVSCLWERGVEQGVFNKGVCKNMLCACIEADFLSLFSKYYCGDDFYPFVLYSISTHKNRIARFLLDGCEELSLSLQRRLLLAMCAENNIVMARYLLERTDTILHNFLYEYEVARTLSHHKIVDLLDEYRTSFPLGAPVFG